MTPPPSQNLIHRFARHKVASNLLMIIMILAGVWALTKLNTQFLPNFALEFITVQTVWRGAAAEDVETSITIPIEQELRNLAGVKKMTSTSAMSLSFINLEYEQGSDMGVALDQVKEAVALLRNLPSTAEKPEISKAVHYELIARLLISGPEDPNELRHLARKMEHELLERGIAKVDISGLPKEEIAIQIPGAVLEELGLTLGRAAEKIAAVSHDLPAGSVGRDDIARQLRSLGQLRDEAAFADIPLLADKSKLLRLGDVARIERRYRQGELRISYQGKPAVELNLFRAEHNDALKTAQIVETWLAETRPQMPPGVKLRLYDEVWKLIDGRIMLLLKNGLGGLALVVLILYLFLNGRVAGWVAAGIPVSLMATQAVLYSFGGSINMVSLFAMIMALGIIVDDAIVVGEDALTHYQNGENPLEAAEGGARRMLAPVMASSLTSIAAFMPLMLISGAMGNILFAIPLVVVCVILASLLECFLVLPGHLHHSFLKLHHRQAPPLRRHLDSAVEHLREKHFRPLISAAISWRWTVLSAALALLILGVGLLVGGRLNFTFFPTAEGMILSANVNFAAGTPPARVDAFLSRLEKSLKTAEQKLGGGLVTIAISLHGSASSPDGSVRKGDQFGSMRVELLPPDNRSVRNREFIKTWKALTLPAPGLENFTISERRGGPPGRDIDISLSGDDPEQMKAAAEELTAALKTFPGVSAIGDNMPFGREQLVYRLRPEAIARGLTVESTGSQLRAAFDGRLVQIFLDGKDEVEVRVMLPDEERYHLATLNHLTIRLPDGAGMPLLNCVELTPRRGFEALRHQQGKLAVGITADVDKELNNSNKILDKLSETLLTELSSRYHLEYSLEGRAADQAETLADMMRGLVFALALIYLVLAWVFSSYGWPLAVMAAIPFGLIGALTGHLLMNIDLTILSLFGFFGLSGIVVNDSIVLVMFYKQQREAGSGVREGLIEAACQRLRAVLLTSLTTIGGLLPLLFETSLEAQFLIPMAVSISFGLIFSTVLVLLVVPVLLSIYEKPIMNDK